MGSWQGRGWGPTVLWDYAREDETLVSVGKVGQRQPGDFRDSVKVIRDVSRTCEGVRSP